MGLPEMVNIFREEPGKPASSLVAEKELFESGDNSEEAFIEYAKRRYKGASFLDGLKFEDVEEYFCRYDGINGRYVLTTKDCQGSFPVYYINVWS